MKKILLLTLAGITPVLMSAQTFWTENFNNGCSAGCAATTWNGWTQTITGVEGADPNLWYVSCAENGHTPTICGTACQPASATATLASLHVGSNPNSLGDAGAAYDAGGLCGLLTCPQTNRRIESPVINCTGQSNITIAFNYIETGAAPNDDASLWYNSGSGWTLLANTPATNNSGCGGQGRWTAYSNTLPASCNNNANVRIGFLWVNNDDGVGTDPSFAVDDITLSVPTVAPPVAAFTASSLSICTGQSVNFTDNSTGGPTSWSWTFPSGTPGTSTSQSPSGVVWNTAGTYTITLTATNANGSNSTTQAITVTATPTVTATGGVTICQGASTTLTSSGATSYNWMPGSLTGNSVSVTPATTTTYTVTGTTGTCSSTAQVTVTVQVCAAPVAAFTPSSTSVCTGTAVNFADNSTGGPTSWSWTFPSGTPPTSTSPSPSGIVWNTAGTYTVTLTVSNVNGSNSTTQVITVSPSPTVTVLGGTTICQGASTTLTVSGATSYNWMPGSLTGSSVSVTPATTTTYTVTGTSGSCTDTAQVTVVVQVCAVPVSNFTASSTNVCAGIPVTFTDNSTGGPTSWSWTFPSGTPASANTQNPGPVVWNTAGTYTVTLTVTNPNGSNSSTQVITVNAPPNVTATSNNAAVCAGASATLTAGGGVSYTWLPGGQTTSPITVNPATTTTYTVTGIGVNGCPDTAQVTVVVNAAPAVVATALNANICNGQSTTLTAGGAQTYTWQPGGLNGVSVIVAPTTTTTYTVNGTDINGCSNTAQVTVVVQNCSAPVAGLSASDNSICEGTCISFTDQSIGGATSWNWQFPGGSPGTSTTQNPASVCYNTAGTYTVTLIASNVTGSDTTTQVITVGAPSPVSITPGPSTQVAIGNSVVLNASGGSGSFTWSPGTGLSCNPCASPTATPLVTTTYTVTMTDAFGCQSSDTVLVKVEEKYNLFVPSAFSPNGDGINDELFVRGAGIKSLEFVVFSRIGEKVFETTDKNVGWDGTFRGLPMNTDVFTYYVKAVFYNSTSETKKGDVTLVR